MRTDNAIYGKEKQENGNRGGCNLQQPWWGYRKLREPSQGKLPYIKETRKMWLDRIAEELGLKQRV